MANRRMLSRRVAMSKKLSRVSWAAESIWYRCLPFTDDAGRMEADPEELRATILPLGKGGRSVPLSHIRKWLAELQEAGLLQLYSVNGSFYLQFEKWDTFQTLKGDRAPKIDCPEPDGNQWNPVEPLKGSKEKGMESK